MRLLRFALFTTLVFISYSLQAYDFEVNGIYYNKLSNSEVEVTYKKYGEASYSGTLNIPESVTYGNQIYKVTKIGESAFRDCVNIVGSLTIPNSVTSIGDFAFKNCVGFRGPLIIPNSVTGIGKYAFSECNGFTGALTIPNSVITIGDLAFFDCRGLIGSLIIPNSVTKIGEAAFYNCKGFSGTLTISNSVTTIENNAFDCCSGFRGSLTIPNSVTSIGKGAFASCYGFTGTLTIPNSVTSIEQTAFYCCSGFTELIIPNSVTSIEQGAFTGCSGFTELIIPNSVKSIGPKAFWYCTKLEQVKSEIVNPFSITEDVFLDISSNAVLQVPKGTKSSYQQFSGWIQHFKEIVEESGTDPTTYTLNVIASGNGSATYNGTTARNQTRTFTVNQGTSPTISFAPDNGYRIGSVLVNNTNVTSSVYNNQYTIGNITANTTVSVTFEQSITSLTYDGVKYRVISFDNKTVNMANGSYAQSITIPASFYSQGFTWTVVGIDNNALSNSPNLSAIIWNPNISFTASVSNPNLLLYVKASQYAPSAIKNVIVNNIASHITLTDAADGNDFYCPQEFTAQNISYTHTYGMTTGIDYAMGWESLALPFDVKNITHSSKGSLLPFAKWSSQANAKPFWLYELKASGFVAATDIKANTPYIISMPNNSQYDSNYNVNGTITFSSSNVVVKKSDNLNTAISGSKYLVPNFSNRASNVGFYALNVKNNYEQNNSSFRDGSIFVKNLRKIHPFEAYIWMSGNNAKEYIPIFEDETTPIWLPEIPMNEKTPEKVYNLNGQQVNSNEFRLPKGIYVIKGKKIVIK